MFGSKSHAMTLASMAVIILAGAVEAQAGTITSLYGDKDAFGIPGAAPAVPPDGTRWQDDLGGVFFTDYRSAFDLANAPATDIWASAGSVSFVHSYVAAAGTYVSATLAMQIAGIADVDGPKDVYFNGTLIGTIPTHLGANNFQEVLLYSFAVPTGLLTGSDTVTFATGASDGYAINFSELTIDTVPLPSSALMGLGLLGGVGIAARLRKRRPVTIA